MYTRRCRLCGNSHKVNKVEFKNGTKHLFLECSKKRVYIPYEELDIPLTLSKKQILAKKQATLL